MAIDARLGLSLRRNEARRFSVRVIGISAEALRVAAPRMQIRDRADAGGPPSVDLAVVTDGNQGIYVETLPNLGALPVAMLRILISKATASDAAIFPYGALGDVQSVAYGLQWGGATRLYGDINVLPSAIDSDAAPADRPIGSGTEIAATIDSGASLTIAAEDVVELIVDGAGEIAGLIAAATNAAERVEAARAQIERFTDAAAKAVRVVADYGARDSIPAVDRFDGLTVWVRSDRRWFTNELPGSVGDAGWKTPVWDVPPAQGTMLERNRIALDARRRGFRFTVTDGTAPWPTYEWRLAGDPGETGPLTIDDWVRVPAEVRGLRIVSDYGERDGIPINQRFNGMLAYVAGDRRLFVNDSPALGGNQGWRTPDFFTPYSVGTLAERNRVAVDARKRGFRFTVAEGARPWVTYEWRITGDPSIDADGAPPLAEADWVALKASAASDAAGASAPIVVTPQSPAWAAQTEALVVGDSLSSPGYTTALAASTGLSVVRTSLGGQTSRKAALRVGALSLALTLAGNTLPAAGATGIVTLVNGAAPSYANADAILHTAPGDAGPGHAITGTFCRAAPPDPSGVIPPALAIARATITHRPGSAPDVYEVAQLGGAGAVAIPMGTLFVPDWARKLATAEVWLCVGRNDPDFADTKRNISAIVALTRGQRVVLSGVLNGTGEGKGTAGLAAIKALNAWMRVTYADIYSVDAAGRDNRERLIASGNATGDDATDRANEVIPRSLREVLPGGATDPFHLNAAGYQVWADGAAEFRAVQPDIVEISASEPFALTIGGRSRRFAVASVLTDALYQSIVTRLRADGHIGGPTPANALTSPVDGRILTSPADGRILTRTA